MSISREGNGFVTISKLGGIDFLISLSRFYLVRINNTAISSPVISSDSSNASSL